MSHATPMCLSPEGKAVKAPQQHGRGHAQDQLACTKVTDQVGASPKVLMKSPTLEGPAPVGNLLGRRPLCHQECLGPEAHEDVATAAKTTSPILSVPGHQKCGCPLTRQVVTAGGPSWHRDYHWRGGGIIIGVIGRVIRGHCQRGLLLSELSEGAIIVRVVARAQPRMVRAMCKANWPAQKRSLLERRQPSRH